MDQSNQIADVRSQSRRRGQVPPAVTTIAIRERLAQLNCPKDMNAVPDAEALIYLITKSASPEFGMRDQRLSFHLLRKLVKRYIAVFPHMNPNPWDNYASLEDSDREYLCALKKHIYGKKEQLYKAQIRDYAEKSCEKFGLYLDPHFTTDIPKNGKGTG